MPTGHKPHRRHQLVITLVFDRPVSAGLARAAARACIIGRCNPAVITRNRSMPKLMTVTGFPVSTAKRPARYRQAMLQASEELK